MIHYYCTYCSAPLKSGDGMCVCGQVFRHSVPPAGDDSGEGQVIYWPPRAINPIQAIVQNIAMWWNGIGPKWHAITIGGTCFVMLVCLIVSTVAGGFNWRNHGSNPNIRFGTPVQPILIGNGPKQAAPVEQGNDPYRNVPSSTTISNVAANTQGAEQAPSYPSPNAPAASLDASQQSAQQESTNASWSAVEQDYQHASYTYSTAVHNISTQLVLQRHIGKECLINRRFWANVSHTLVVRMG